MGREYEHTWPRCGCTTRCIKPKCLHASGTELAKQAASLSLVGRKNSPERMTVLLKKVMEFPNVTKACAFSGIVYSTLKYWIKRSQEGQPGDGFDLEFGEEIKRFHQHWEDALDAGVQMVEDAYVARAVSGYYETLHHQGRVQYQYDEKALALGETGPAAYLLDEDGKPIPERIHLQDPEVQLAVLKAWRRDRYGQHDMVTFEHRGGVMVVTAPARTSAELEERAKRMQNEVVDVEFIEVEPEAQ